jgi:L-rhamnose mutarotase
MQRAAFKMQLKPGCLEEYQKRHANIWPELAELLRQAGIHEYSIFHDPQTNTLFAFQKQQGESSSQDLGQNPIVQQWWAHMADLMETNPDHSPVSAPLHEVFYLE